MRSEYSFGYFVLPPFRVQEAPGAPSLNPFLVKPLRLGVVASQLRGPPRLKKW